jgi:hypothetical protein
MFSSIIIIIIIMFVSKVSTLWAIDIKWKKGELVSKISWVLVSLQAIHYYISSGLESLKCKYCYDIVNAFGCNSLSLLYLPLSLIRVLPNFTLGFGCIWWDTIYIAVMAPDLKCEHSMGDLLWVETV